MNKLILEIKLQLFTVLPIWFITVITAFLPDNSLSVRLRGYLVSLFLPGRPKEFLLGRDVTILSPHRLYIGKRVYFAKGCWINAIGRIDIEDEVFLAPYSVISSSNHGFKDNSVWAGGSHPKPVTIGKGSWIASHAVVTAGCSIGSGNILGANSVLTTNTESNSIYAGVPARFVKIRQDNPSTIQSKHDIAP